MKKLIALCSVFYISYSIAQVDTTEIDSYFNEIAYGNEFDPNEPHQLRKWKTDINIFVFGDKKAYMLKELDLIVKELNDLIIPININVINDSSKANCFIYLGSHLDFNKLDPRSNSYTALNEGLGIIKKSKENIIYHASIYVDMYRTDHNLYRLHILREELTQILGLINDSWKYPESIFYQGYTFTTEYTELDREIIKKLYN